MRAILLDCERDQSSTLRAERVKSGTIDFACVTWFVFTAQALPSSCWTGLRRGERVSKPSTKWSTPCATPADYWKTMIAPWISKLQRFARLS